MGAITGTLKDSLRTAANGRFLTGIGAAAVFEDTLLLPESAIAVIAGAVSITLAANAQFVPDTLTYTFRVQDPSGVQRYAISGVTVTAAYDTLDDIL